MTGFTIGSLFTGAGMLDRAAEQVFGARTVWVSDIDKGACKVLAHRYPHAPNLGDITRINWATVPRVDIITGGYPCQPFSQAGRRLGQEDERHLWPYVADALAVLRPTFVLFENVRGHLSLGFDEVVRDLHQLGYDAEWVLIRASDIGACHQRARLFILGVNRERRVRSASAGAAEGSRTDRPVPLGRVVGDGGEPVWPDTIRGKLPDEWEHDRGAPVRCSRAGRPDLTLLPTPTVSDTNGAGAHSTGGADLRTAVQLLPTLRVENNENRQSEGYGGNRGNFHGLMSGAVSWGEYAAAIARHEQAWGVPAPEPTEPGPKGNPRLSAAFCEWMMMQPAGWITDVPGVTRNEALKLCGNGVVTPQAVHALRVMLYRIGAA